jgi:hypothetical protein
LCHFCGNVEQNFQLTTANRYREREGGRESERLRVDEAINLLSIKLARAKNVDKDQQMILGRVARLFLVQHSKIGKNIPNNHKIDQMGITYTN